MSLYDSNNPIYIPMPEKSTLEDLKQYLLSNYSDCANRQYLLQHVEEWLWKENPCEKGMAWFPVSPVLGDDESYFYARWGIICIDCDWTSEESSQITYHSHKGDYQSITERYYYPSFDSLDERAKLRPIKGEVYTRSAM